MMEGDSAGKQEILQSLLAGGKPPDANNGKTQPLPPDNPTNPLPADKSLSSKKLSPPRSNTQSPDPNCSICLGKLENKSFTDSCFHMFCFACLLEWSKVKAECPLCKQPFKSIIHNVRSYEDYDQYHVQETQPERPTFPWDSPEGYRFRYRTTVNFDRLMESHYREQQRQLRLLQRPTVTTRHQWRRHRQGATSDFRQRIYRNGMRVREVTSRKTRQRKMGPEFYISNPACTHRLVPWLNRELNALLHSQPEHVHFLMELIMDLIKRFEIESEEFFEHLQSYIGRHTQHFVHEFLNFARSPYDMIAYDKNAVYEHITQTIDSEHNSSSSSSAGSDIIIVDEIVGGPSNIGSVGDSNQNRRQSLPSDTHNPEPPSADQLLSVDFSPILSRVQSFVDSTRNLMSNSGWDSPTPGPSGMFLSPPEIQIPSSPSVTDTVSSSTTTASTSTVNLSPTKVSSSTIKSEEKSKISTRAVSETTAPINATSDSDADSDNSSVVILKVEKPWDQRTPILLSSDSEEERMIMNLEKNRDKKRKKKPQNDHAETGARQRSHSGMSHDWSSDSTLDVVGLGSDKRNRKRKGEQNESHKNHKRKKSKTTKSSPTKTSEPSSNEKRSKDKSSKRSRHPSKQDYGRDRPSINVEPQRHDSEEHSANRISHHDHHDEEERRREQDRDLWCTSYSRGRERGLSPLSCVYGYQSSYGGKYGEFFQWLHYNEDRYPLDGAGYNGDHGYYRPLAHPLPTSHDGRLGRHGSRSRSHERERQTHRSRSRTPSVSPKKRSAEKDKHKRGKRSRSNSVEFIGCKSSKHSAEGVSKKHHKKHKKHKKHKHKKTKAPVEEIDLEAEAVSSKPNRQSTAESVDKDVYVELQMRNTPIDIVPLNSEGANTDNTVKSADQSDKTSADSVCRSSSKDSLSNLDSSKRYKKHPTGHKTSGKNGKRLTVKIKRTFITEKNFLAARSVENHEHTDPEDGSIHERTAASSRSTNIHAYIATNRNSIDAMQGSASSSSGHTTDTVDHANISRSSDNETDHLQGRTMSKRHERSNIFEALGKRDKKAESWTRECRSPQSVVSNSRAEDTEEIDVVTCDVSPVIHDASVKCDVSSTRSITCDVSPVEQDVSPVPHGVSPVKSAVPIVTDEISILDVVSCDESSVKYDVPAVTCDTSTLDVVTCDRSPDRSDVRMVTCDTSTIDVVSCDESPVKCDVPVVTCDTSTLDVVTCDESPDKCDVPAVTCDTSTLDVVTCDASPVKCDVPTVTCDTLTFHVVTCDESPVKSDVRVVTCDTMTSTLDAVTGDASPVTHGVSPVACDTMTSTLDVVTCDESSVKSDVSRITVDALRTNNGASIETESNIEAVFSDISLETSTSDLDVLPRPQDDGECSNVISDVIKFSDNNAYGSADTHRSHINIRTPEMQHENALSGDAYQLSYTDLAVSPISSDEEIDVGR